MDTRIGRINKFASSSWLLLLLIFLLSSAQECFAGLCATIIRKEGYPCHEHQVTTKDGFVLGLQNIPHGIKGPNAQPGSPIFLQHGVLQGGDDWVLNGPQESLAYVAADAGYDVWIASSRSSTWSYGHVKYSKSEREYWDWTWDDLAAYDTPAFLSFIYEIRQTRIFYVGHSQGTVTALAAFSQDKSVTDKLAAAALLSPICFMGNVRSMLARTASFLYIDKLFEATGLAEFSIHNDVGAWLLVRVCAVKGVDCGDLLTAVTGPNCCIEPSRWPYYLQFEPQSTSSKNLVHYAQMVRKANFAKHDYGVLGNLVHYGSVWAPSYNLAAIPKELPLFFGCGGQDWLSGVKDVNLLRAALERDVDLLHLPNYGHADLVIGRSAKADLYDPMLLWFQSHAVYVHAVD